MRVLISPRMQNIWVDITDEQITEMKDAGATEIIVVTNREEEIDAIRSADVFVGAIDPELFEHAGQLQWVSSVSAGVDGFIFPEFVESDILLTSQKGLVGEHLADHGFGLLLSLTRSIAWAARQRSWENRLEMREENVELTDLTMGIVGLGGTGIAMADRAAAFGMSCLAVDPEEVKPHPAVREVFSPDQIVEMATQSNVLAVCCPRTPETIDLVDRDVLFAMPQGSYIVNVTRGGVINEPALIEAIESGQIAGAGLDVASQEPLPADSPLWSYDNIVITPHTAGASQYRASRAHQRLCRNISNFASGKPLEGLVDKHKGY